MYVCFGVSVNIFLLWVAVKHFENGIERCYLLKTPPERLDGEIDL